MGLRTSLPLGKWFGVELRLHTFFFVLMSLTVIWATLDKVNALRGVALWGLLLFAVLVRETARGLVAAWFGIEMRSLVLLPTGGVPVYGTLSGAQRATEGSAQWGMLLAGPVANALTGLVLAGLMLGVAPEVDLGFRAAAGHWVAPEHLLRTAVWVNLLLALVNLLPAWPLDGGRVLHSGVGSGLRPDVRRVMLRLGPGIALSMILFGMLSVNWWAMMIGMGILLGGQAERQGLPVDAAGDQLKVRDVMLAEYSIMSGSATLEDAVLQARHTLQDVFPVVRAGNMVGAVSRGEIMQALESTGNGYVQGIMARTFSTAAPEDGLVATLGRVTGAGGAASQLVPVVDGERIVGILTPQNLQRSMGLVIRRAGFDSMPGARSAGAGSDDERRAAGGREDERD